jgi:hypothetical protein
VDLLFELASHAYVFVEQYLVFLILLVLQQLPLQNLETQSL